MADKYMRRARAWRPAVVRRHTVTGCNTVWCTGETRCAASALCRQMGSDSTQGKGAVHGFAHRTLSALQTAAFVPACCSLLFCLLRCTWESNPRASLPGLTRPSPLSPPSCLLHAAPMSTCSSNGSSPTVKTRCARRWWGLLTPVVGALSHGSDCGL